MPRHPHDGQTRQRTRISRSAADELINFICLLLILNVSSSHQTPPTMAITTRSTAPKEKPISQALVVTTATPIEGYQDQQLECLARSPRTSNVNNHIPEINRPTTRLNNVLEVLRPSRNTTTDDPDDNLDAPCDLTPLTYHGEQTSTHNLPTGVDAQDKALEAPAKDDFPHAGKVTDTRTTPPSRSIRINKTATTASSSEDISHESANSRPKGASQSRQSILMSTSTSIRAPKEQGEYDDSSPTDGRTCEIHDRDQKLYRVFSEDR